MPLGKRNWCEKCVLNSVLRMLFISENEMKTPKSYKGLTGVLNRGFAIIVVLYIGMGLFGYLKYGDAIKESITLNLSQNLHTQVDKM